MREESLALWHVRWHLKTVQWIETKTIMALQMVRTRGTQLLGTTKILVAPVVHKLWARLQHVLLGIAHVFVETGANLVSAQIVVSAAQQVAFGNDVLQ